MKNIFENILKFECKDKNGEDLFVLQNTENGNTKRWYFKKDFSTRSAKEFIKQFCEWENTENIELKNTKIYDEKKGRSNGGR